MIQDNVQTLDRFQGCLLGAAIGDALGMPAESMTQTEILLATKGQGITDFIAPIQTKIPELRKLMAGRTTDDWQLTHAVARSLIRCEEFDIYDQALSHVDAYHDSTVGWGGTTKKSIEELHWYFGDYGTDGRRPTQKPVLRGAGNGVAMKIAPIALAGHGKQRISLDQQVKNLAWLTHSHPAAISGALVVADLIFLYTNINFHDIKINWLLRKNVKDKTFEKLELLAENFDRCMNEPIEYAVALLGNRCVAYESVPLAIAIAFRNQDNFEQGVIEAVNAGGDTDTIGSMVGAILGAKLGVGAIPDRWLNFSEVERAMKLATNLHQTFKT